MLLFQGSGNVNIIVLPDKDGLVGKQVNHRRETQEGDPEIAVVFQRFQRIQSRKTKNWYHLDLGEELEKCPAVAQSVMVHYLMGSFLFYLQAGCFKALLYGSGR